jgi:hypothetical protein
MVERAQLEKYSIQQLEQREIEIQIARRKGESNGPQNIEYMHIQELKKKRMETNA